MSIPYPSVEKWQSPDSEENYKHTNSGKSNYTKDEIEYKLNSHGYRCDEFSRESEFPILFMGCSLTEGIGLPFEEIWSYHLHEKISNKTHKKIPFWSLAKGGASIDYAARCFYNYGHQLKPKYAFYLMGSIFRREFCLETPDRQHWFPKYAQSYKPNKNFISVSEIFSDPEFAMYQTLRSILILQAVAEKINCKIFIFGLDIDLHIVESKKINFFSTHKNISYFPISWVKMLASPKNVPEKIKKRPPMARDIIHPGALWQYNVFNFIWENTQAEILTEKIL